MRMGDDNGFPAVEIAHQRFQFLISKVLPIAVRSQFYTVSSKYLQCISGFFQGPVHVRQGKGRAEEESARIQGFQRRSLFVELPANEGRFCTVAEIRLRSRHGQDRGLYSRLVHEFQMLFSIPCRDGKSFVHHHPVGLYGFQIRIRNHMAVHINLSRR